MRSRSRKGLSPRVRGNHHRQGNRSGRTGPIPACAGQPVGYSNGELVVRAYPRVCGATSGRAKLHRRKPGLSPRVRGNLFRSAWPGLPARPIPACAGQPWTRNFHSHLEGAYPRVCGATWLESHPFTGSEGLSPRVRGNHNHIRNIKRLPGPIPACAGQPILRHFEAVERRAYPRVCGATRL